MANSDTGHQPDTQAFAQEGMGHQGPWEQVRGQIWLGHDALITRLQPALKQRRAIPDVPKAPRFAGRPRLEDLFQDVAQHPKVVRNQLIQQAHEAHGYTLAAIAQVVGLYTTRR